MRPASSARLALIPRAPTGDSPDPETLRSSPCTKNRYVLVSGTSRNPKETAMTRNALQTRMTRTERTIRTLQQLLAQARMHVMATDDAGAREKVRQLEEKLRRAQAMS